jgi:nucleoid-associated protein YgaU
LNLKAILKALKLNESTISMVLGALVIVIAGVLVVNYFKDKGASTLPFLQTEDKGVLNEIIEPKSYTVQKGDSLWNIAEANYGSGYNWVDIASVNKLANPGEISEGQVLTLPAVEPKVSTVTKVEETVVTMEPITGESYTVVKGDNLWNISVRAYGDGYKWVELARLNNLSNPDLIYPGNVLNLPR